MKNNMKMKSKGLSGSGWHGESMRHSQAAKGISTGRKVTPKEFFIHRFKRDPEHRAEQRYFKEWEGRFAKDPESYMDDKSLKVYRELQEKKKPLPKGYKGKGGIQVKIVEVQR